MTAFDDSAVISGPTKTDEIVVPANSCVVVCVNVQCEPVIILNYNIPLLCVRITARLKMYKISNFISLLCLT